MKPTALIILDGFGYANTTKHNAIAQAKTPNLDHYFTIYPHTTIQASGNAVGLPKGAIGNSEVGHLTIGAGRIIDQPAVRLNKLITEHALVSHPVLVEKYNAIQSKNGALHIMGLLSDANVHSHENHLYALIDAALENGVHTIYVHAFLDGRDTPPQSAAIYLQHLDSKINALTNVHLASVHGRFYAMDRDKNWERIHKTYDVLTATQSSTAHDWQSILEQQYAKGNNDEFIEPTQLNPNGTIKDGDGILFFNFRPDRARELTQSFIDPNFHEFKIKHIKLSCFITPVEYEHNHLHTDILLKPIPIKNTLKEILNAKGLRIFTAAETEKYAHVTYFFNGGKEETLSNETRKLIKSIPARDYVQQPEMSAEMITDAARTSLQKDPHDFYLINYANADMVGHSSNMAATIKAIEYLDQQIGKLHEQIIEKMDGTIFLTADHGNAESMFDEVAQQPRTAHTNNPVPFIMMCNQCKNTKKKLPVSQLADIAPFILHYLKIDLPKEMIKTSYPNTIE